MKSLLQRLSLAALVCLPVGGVFATSWTYVGHYPWTFSLEDGWFYQLPTQKVWMDGAWRLSPMGHPFDIAPLFESPLTVIAGTDGEDFVFRLTISSAFPHLGLLQIGDYPPTRDKPVVNEVDNAVFAALDPTGRVDLPDVGQEGRFDTTYLVRMHRLHDDILGRAYFYFQADHPFTTWADRGAIHGMMQLKFRSAERGVFVVAGNFNEVAGLEAFRGHFKAAALEPPPPPPDVEPPSDE